MDGIPAIVLQLVHTLNAKEGLDQIIKAPILNLKVDRELWAIMAMMTKAMKREALLIFERGYTMQPLSYRGLPRNRPLWKLVNMGLAEFDSGPRGSWLKSVGFMPLWSDPIC